MKTSRHTAVTGKNLRNSRRNKMLPRLRAAADRCVVEQLENRRLLTGGPGTINWGPQVAAVQGFQFDYRNAFATQADGKFLVGGYVTNAGTGKDFAVARYNANGTLDSTFAPGGADGNGVTSLALSGDQDVKALTLDRTGNIVVAGASDTGSVQYFAVARFGADGTPETAFGTGGMATALGTPDGATGPERVASAYAVGVQKDGDIVAAGQVYVDNGTASRFDFGLAVFAPNGTATSIQNNFLANNNTEGANSLAIGPDDSIVVAGTSDQQPDGVVSGTTNSFVVAKYTAAGELDTGFGGTDGFVDVGAEMGLGSNASGRSVALQADGKIVAAGSVTNPSTSDTDFAVIRLNTSGSADTTFGAGGVVKTSFTAAPATDIAGSIAIQTDAGGTQKIVAAGATGSNGSIGIARYNLNGSLDTTFDGDGKLTIAATVERVPGLAIQTLASSTGTWQTNLLVAGVNTSDQLILASVAATDAAPASPDTVYVDEADPSVGWNIWTDVGAAGLSYGDTVANGAVTGIFGVDAFSSIQNAVTGVNAGGTVNVFNGLYKESNITIGKDITIDGQSRAGVVVAPAGEDSNENSLFGGTYQHGFLIRSSGVTIQDLTIDGEANTSLTAGKNNFRVGIMNDHLTGVVYDNSTIQYVSVQHVYRRGIQFNSVVGGGRSVGNLVADSSVNDVELAGGGYGIVVFEAEAEVRNNTVSNASSGIAANYINTAANAPIVNIHNNTVNNVDYGLDISGLGEGSVLTANTVNVAGRNTGVGIVVQYVEGQSTVSNNTVTGSGADAGIWLYHNENAAKPVLVQSNTFTTTASTSAAAGEGTGIFLTDNGDLFGDEDGSSYATLTGNTVSDFAVGIDLSRNGNSPAPGRPVVATVSGNTVNRGSVAQLRVNSAGSTITGNTLTGTMPRDGKRFDGTADYSTAAIYAANTMPTAVTINEGLPGDQHTIWANIQGGVNAAAPTNIVGVKAGTYEEQVIIDKAVSLRGPNVGKAGNAGDREPEAIIQFPTSAPNGEALVSADADGVTLDGFDLRYQDSRITDHPGGYGYLWGSAGLNNLTIRNNRMYSSEVPIYIWPAGYPTSSSKSGLLIEGNYIDCGPFVNDSYNRGMYIGNTAGTIQDNVVVNANIGIQYMPYANPTAGLIQRNTVSAGKIGLYHNYQNKGAAPVTWTQNVVTVAPNDRLGLKALAGVGWTGPVTFRGIEIITFGLDTGAAPSVTFTNNSVDATLTPGTTYNSTVLEAVRFTTPYEGGTATFTNNSFTGWTTAVNNAMAATFPMSGNWWGTTSETTINAGIANTGGGGIDFTAYLGKGTDTAPSTIGFQGDFSDLYVTTLGAQTGTAGRIQEGVDLVTTGGTVHVNAGTYTESNILVPKAVTIDGQSRAGVVLNSAIVDSHDNSSWSGTVSNGFVIGADNVTIKDLTIDGQAGQNYRQGIITTGNQDSVVIDDVAMKDIFRKGVALYGNGHTTGNSITNSTFDRIGNNSSSFEGTFAIAVFQGDATITGNTITNSAAGIGTNYFGVESTAGNVTITGNTVSAPLTSASMTAIGLDISGVYGTVSGNTVNMTGGSGHDIGIVGQFPVTGQTLTITGNAVTADTGDTGIMAYYASDASKPLVITNNTVGGTGFAKGILVTKDGSIFGETPNAGTTYATVSGNTVTGGTVAQIAVDSSGSTFTNNQLLGTMPTNGKRFDGTADYSTAAIYAANTMPTAVMVNQGLAGDQHDIWANIQGGVNAASPTDTVSAESGTYSEQVLVIKALTITGKPGDHAVVGPDSGAPVLDGTAFAEGVGFDLARGIDDVTIEGFVIQNFHTASDDNGVGVGVRSYNTSADPSNNVTVRDNTFIDNEDNAVMAYNEGQSLFNNWNLSFNSVANSYYGLELTNATNSSIDHNVITGGTMGVLLTAQTYSNRTFTAGTTTVNNNTISGSAYSGIAVTALTQAGSGVSTLSDITLSNNTLTTVSSGSGIVVWDYNQSVLADVTASGNNIAGPGQGIKAFDSGTLNLIDNTLAPALAKGGTLTRVATVNYTTRDLAADTFTVNATQMWDNANKAFDYSGVTNLNVNTLGGDDAVTVRETGSVVVTVDTGDGSDTLNYETSDARDDVVVVGVAPLGGPEISNTINSGTEVVQKVRFSNTEIRNIRLFGGSDSFMVQITSPPSYMGYNIFGGEGNDLLVGGLGDDLIEGGAGNDRIDGRNGNDTLRGQDGNDVMYGGNGNDILDGGFGRNQMFGQNGDDIFYARYAGSRDMIDGGAGYDKAQVDALDQRSLIEELLA